MKKEKLNKKDTEKVSGGYTVEYEKPKYGDFVSDDGKTYEIFCDACDKPILGNCSTCFTASGNRQFCLDCALKMQQLLKSGGIDDSFGFEDLKFNPNQKY